MASGTIKHELNSTDFVNDYVDVNNNSISANSALYINFNMGKPGYKCLMVSGCRVSDSASSGTGSTNVITAQIDMWDMGVTGAGTAGIRFKNQSSSAAKVDVRAFGLYVKA